LVACFAKILMSLALPGTSLISWLHLLHEAHWLFLFLYYNRWGFPWCPTALFFSL
jgi:hypothetical protein